MDHLWTPWRYRYVSTAGEAVGCLFCNKAAESDDRKNYVLLRAELNFVMLNLYPYSPGHLMIAPYAHVATLEESDPRALQEMMLLAQKTEAALRSVYQPQGLNLGINVGRSAGAGVPGHLHLHVLPRWAGDTSFITTVAETRVLPEDLDVTYERLSAVLGKA